MKNNPCKEKDILMKVLKSDKKRIYRTRMNRINLSERLKRYSKKWNIIIFLLNIEAVVLIIMVISQYKSNPMSVFSGVFSAYVILLQYFINEQKYSERSLKSHYHQLELGDNIHELDNCISKIKLEEKFEEKEILETRENVLREYQLTLKNNENHAEIDDINNLIMERKGQKRLIDFSSDNIFAFMNFIVVICVLVYIFISLGSIIYA